MVPVDEKCDEKDEGDDEDWNQHSYQDYHSVVVLVVVSSGCCCWNDDRLCRGCAGCSNGCCCGCVTCYQLALITCAYYY